MILTEKEINNMPVNLGTLWIIKKSHIEALDKIKELDPYYYISKWEYYEDRTDQLAVIADALANALEETKAKLQELEDEKRCLEMRLEDCRLEAEGIIAKSHFEANARISELEEILHAFLRAPSTGSDGPGSSTIVIQEYHLRDARAALKAAKGGVMTTKAINIVFDGPPGPEAGRFVEVETDDGESIKIGEWEERPDGLWALRITQLPWHHSKQ